MKQISIKTQYILLGQLLKYLGIITNGGEAKNFIIDNCILLNGERVLQRGKKIYPDDVIVIDDKEYFLVKEDTK